MALSSSSISSELLVDMVMESNRTSRQLHQRTATILHLIVLRIIHQILDIVLFVPIKSKKYLKHQPSDIGNLIQLLLFPFYISRSCL
ncbi:hypothetical protein L2E82_29730 [Cichorium intybus]|uniref:Uncharacterized protein n=1 Tax=Cichorium intybus TaxID=13427 RepID=A0ACB9CYB6_CICIN|nr:hypothetical protein L2E82_29730 [Cichorium intybus]